MHIHVLPNIEIKLFKETSTGRYSPRAIALNYTSINTDFSNYEIVYYIHKHVVNILTTVHENNTESNS